MDNTLHNNNVTIKMNGIIITELRFTDENDRIASSEDELVSLTKNIYHWQKVNFGWK